MLAMRLLQLKTVATTHHDLPAEHVVPKLWLKMLGALRQRKLSTLWRGLDKLILAVSGFVAIKKKCG